MKLLTSKDYSQQPLGLVLGNFDGLHRAHRVLIESHIRLCAKQGLAAGLITFSPHPASYFSGRPQKQLLSLGQKKEILGRMGLDYYIDLDFDEGMASLGADDFAEKVLKGQFKGRYISVGHDYRFGSGRTGTVADLKRLQDKLDFFLYVQPEMKRQGQRISSTAIRNFIRSGQVRQAGQMLGYLPMVEGRVVPGHQLGKDMGFPTANLRVDEKLLIPKTGVYQGYARLLFEVEEEKDTKIYPAMISVGRKPTVGDDFKESIEAHIFHFDQDIYGRRVQLSFARWMREEVRFSDLAALRDQLSQDKKRALTLSVLPEENMVSFPAFLYPPLQKGL